MTDQPDSNPAPKFVPARSGTRMYSLAALLERIEDAFRDEYGDDQLAEAGTRAQRYKLILATTDYVLSVESIQMTADDKADLVRRAYSHLFGFAALDELFADERITTIALNGAGRAAVRYGHDELTNIAPPFDDDQHLRSVIERLLADAGTELRPDLDAIETGLMFNERPVSMSVVLPSIAFGLNVDIRLHPRVPPTLDDLAAAGFMTDEALALIRLLIASRYGFVIAGETETGKTTLLNAIAHELPEPARLVSVERTGELRLPHGAARLIPSWGVDPRSFGDQIYASLAAEPACLLLDEVRAGEPHTIAPLLEMDSPPRQIWVVRGAPDHKRMQSALGMLARRAAPGSGETLVHALYERLPFIITVARTQTEGRRLQLFSIAEWQSRIDTDYPDYVMLMRYQEGRAQPTGTPPARWLD